ncbi:MAG: baseplate J/gp47 family protein [Candidatus Levybacteria bacterium]|nr:baseplate J/gp47 family protein [Candidatus Levybacteria bacterium]
MKLPIPSLFGKKGSSDAYYLALLLRDEKIVAVVLQEIAGQLTTIGTSETHLTTPLEQIPYEELLDTLDKTISRAEDKLPSNIETEKTIFGVKDTWVTDKKINKEQLTLLKKLCDALTLTPIGFMVVSEAIAHLLNKEEGAPLSAIVAEIGQHAASLSLFRAGRVIEAHSAKITDSATLAVDKLLHHFTVDVLPSRIILFNGRDDEQVSQEFISHQWSKSIPFLHVPQISVLPVGFDARAMIHGAGEQMGFTVIPDAIDTAIKTVTGKVTKKADPSADTQVEEKVDEDSSLHSDLDSKSEKEDTAEEDTTTDKADLMPVSGDNFGFVMNQDIESVTPVKAPVASTITSETPPQPHHAPMMPNNSSMARESRTASETTSAGFLAGIMTTIKGLLQKVSFLNPTNPTQGFRFGKGMMIGVGILILLLGGVIWYMLNVKATVTLNIQTKAVDESEDVTFSAGSSNDFSQSILGAKQVEAELDGSVTTDATGKKAIGEKAKGTLTLYNKNEAKRTIPSGTTIRSSTSIEFVTDKEVSIASASGDISGTKAGTGQVSVIAKELGTQANLPSGTEFTVSGYSNVAGKNDSAFSGGTKKDVTVVAKKDADKLLLELPKSLSEKARTEMKSQISDDEDVLTEFTTDEIIKKKFDNDVDDEAKKVTLTGTVSFSTLAYSKKDLLELAQTILKNKSTSDLTISKDDVKATIEDIVINKDEASATLVISGGLIPEIDKNELAGKLSGKSFKDALEVVSSTPQITDAEIVLSPNIPLLPKILPRITKNITIVVSAHD